MSTFTSKICPICKKGKMEEFTPHTIYPKIYWQRCNYCDWLDPNTYRIEKQEDERKEEK